MDENSKLEEYIDGCEGNVDKAIAMLVDEYTKNILKMATEDGPMDLPFFIAAMDIARCIINEKLNPAQKAQVSIITSQFPILNVKIDKTEIMRQVDEIRKKRGEESDG